jgi:hypothetical protein
VWVLRWVVAFEPQVRFYRKIVVWEKVGRLVELYRQGAAWNKLEAILPVVKTEKPVVNTQPLRRKQLVQRT